jgi:MtN3 and saliva related transmembrane protein
MGYIEIVGIAAGCLTAASMLPQLFKTIKEKRVEDLSIGMVVTLLSGIGLWIYYGFLRKDLPILITNSFSLLLNITLVVLYGIYKKK